MTIQRTESATDLVVKVSESDQFDLGVLLSVCCDMIETRASCHAYYYGVNSR